MELFQKQLDRIEVLIEKQNILKKEILSLEEAAKYLQLSKSCLYKITSSKEIPHYVPGGKKIYILKGDLDNWVLSGKVNSVNEINLETERYLGKTSKNQS
ncbi:AlpA family transcriptional regulator [Flavobacterium sp. 83]|uniref:helix-turn-helix transcriptional regulator n=1 Tax=Flavobacterium sp. 83 TaxID=1131812 RepID=UPI0005504723|nr:helix-turn-helix domain-containing protein [Flavobacterium sp. 83]